MVYPETSGGTPSNFNSISVLSPGNDKNEISSNTTADTERGSNIDAAKQYIFITLIFITH